MILYIDGAVRTESRTRELADYLIGKKSDKVEYVRLNEEDILPLKENILSKRNEACQKGDFSDPYFRYAKQFAAADEIVIVAPYWDFSLPSLVKAYLENVCVSGLTFCYEDKDIPTGLCKAKRLYYVTTAGGPILDDAFGYGYVKMLAQVMFGIGEVLYIKAENLDIIGSDVKAIMDRAKEEIDRL